MPSEDHNVVFIITDQHQARALGSVDPSYATPSLDELAAEGVRFDNCYCTYPQCSPSRSTMVTGQYPHQTGVETLANWGPYELAPDAQSVARVFREAGYETVWGGGRWHLGVENITDLGWRLTRNVDINGTPGTYEGVERDGITVEESVDFIRHHGLDGPFFLTASFNLPHTPYTLIEEFAGRYDRDEIPLPDTWDDDVKGKPAPHRERVQHSDLTEEDVRDIGYRYRTMVSQVDAFVGEILDALREAGIREETSVVFTSDHGDMAGAHGMTGKSTVGYDEILRVPLIVRTPSDEPRGRTVDGMISNRIIPGTLIEAAGLPVPDAFEAGSVATPESREEATGDRVFFEHKCASGGHHPLRGVRTRDWKYVEYFGDEGVELYDLDDDPQELVNLAGHPDYTEVQERLRIAAHDWWERTGGDTASWTEPR